MIQTVLAESRVHCKNAAAECFPSAEITPQPVSGAIPAYYTPILAVLKLLWIAVQGLRVMMHRAQVVEHMCRVRAFNKPRIAASAQKRWFKQRP